MVCPTAEPTATPPAVAAICPNNEGCCGAACTGACTGACAGAAGAALAGKFALETKQTRNMKNPHNEQATFRLCCAVYRIYLGGGDDALLMGAALGVGLARPRLGMFAQ